MAATDEQGKTSSMLEGPPAKVPRLRAVNPRRKISIQLIEDARDRKVGASRGAVNKLHAYVTLAVAPL